MIAHAAEPGHSGDPDPGQRCQMNAAAGVVVDVAEVKASGLAKVVVGQYEVPDLTPTTACTKADSEESRTVRGS
jgi:hypothetical protein